MGSAKSLHSPQYKAFLRRLRQARVEANLSQTELAQAVGHSQTWMSKCELGERRVDIIELKAIAEILGKDLEWFLIASTDGSRR
ncbi:MAG: helix-turn-helix transcriptional regulator [Gammaproteobacteria bacterium]|nr:helix-turn-helix transcriptional regulator [Gammaproteobacteria bacterium]